MSLRSQRRLAAEILKAGENRVWLDPARAEDVETAITRVEIRKLVHEGAIKKINEKGVSRSRAQIIHERKEKGRRRGSGRKSGTLNAKTSKKKVWMEKIRALRKNLREWRENHLITQNVYRRLYNMAGSGTFESTVELKRYVESQGLWRRR